jgi:hypothetical protein
MNTQEPRIVRVLLPLHLRQQPEHDRPRRLVLLQVDQQLPEGPSLRLSGVGYDAVR